MKKEDNYTAKPLVCQTLGLLVKSMRSVNNDYEVWASKEKYPIEELLSSNLKSDVISTLSILEDYFKHQKECLQRYSQKPNCNKLYLESEILRINNSLISLGILRSMKLDVWLIIDKCRKELEKKAGLFDNFVVTLPFNKFLQGLVFIDFRARTLSLKGGTIIEDPSKELLNEPLVEPLDIKRKKSELKLAFDCISCHLLEDEHKLNKQIDKPEVNRDYLISELNRLAIAQAAFKHLEDSNPESWLEMYLQMKKVEKDVGLQSAFILEIPLRNINGKNGFLDFIEGEARICRH